ncbi:MAG: DoxX family membrane protein [Armatimonadetes bacterium]|nr:DoxX family membrane protein [Armatimonadota bacterium]
MSRSGRIALACRLLLGAAFVYASLDKIVDPGAFADVVLGYQLLHPKLVTLVAVVLPWIELLAGGLLLIGFLSESCALILGGLSVVFGLAVSSALARGLDIQCGCFSVASGSDPVAWSHLVLDGLLLLLSSAVLKLGPGVFSVDAWLRRRTP